MNEDFLHFIWKFNLFNKHNLVSSTGEPIEVVSTGTHNQDAGPDFLSAKIKIGDTLWVGNVEIHVKSSHWLQHKHQNNGAYDNVILHVVHENDHEIKRPNGETLPALALTFPLLLQQRFDALLASPHPIPCRPNVAQVETFRMRHWLARMAAERLERKSTDIHTLLAQTVNDWDATFHRFLFRYLGFKVNALPFELLAQQLPINLLRKYRHSLSGLEALLFGQAGLLSQQPADAYQTNLQAEYRYLQAKHGLTAMDASLWKFARLRPGNFPTLRLAQAAALLHQTDDLLGSILQPATAKEYILLFDTAASSYWNTHYVFGKLSPHRCTKRLGTKSAERIATNVVAPMLFAYGQSKGDEAMQERALNLLEELPPEVNSITLSWKGAGIIAENTFESQALLQMRTNYCDKKRCLHCPIGKQVIEDKLGQ